MRVQTTPINATGMGDHQLLAAVAGVVHRVVGYVLIAGGSVNAEFQSGAGVGNTPLSGPLPLGASGGASAPMTPRAPNGLHDGWFDTNPGESLNLNLSASLVQVSGHLAYIDIIL